MPEKNEKKNEENNSYIIKIIIHNWSDYNEKTSESGVGDNNVRKWSDFDVLTEGVEFYIEYYHEK